MRRAATLLLLGGFVAIAMARLFDEAFLLPDWYDLRTYAAGSARLLHGEALYPDWQLAGRYVISDVPAGHGYVYPPTAALLLAPLQASPSVWLVWIAISLMTYLGVAWMIIRRELGIRPMGIAVLLALLVAHPGLHSLRAGQASTLIAAFFGAMWLTRHSGLLATAAGLVKATPGIGILWAIRRRESLLLPSLAAGIVVVGTLPFGADLWRDWRMVLANADSECTAWWSLPSFGCAGVPWVGWLMALGLGGIALRAKRDDVAFAALGAAAALLPIEMHWGYLLIPAVAALPLACHIWLRVEERLPGRDRDSLVVSRAGYVGSASAAGGQQRRMRGNSDAARRG
jgi:hypothetical protein